MKIGIMERDQEQKKNPKPFGFYVVLSVLSFVAVLSIMSFVAPETLIGWYLDQDIKSQLTQLNEQKLLELNPNDVETVIVNVRFTFDNDQLKDIRVSRAIDVFNEMFDGIERDHSIKELEDETQLILRWSLLDQTK